jgi:hypothetical protein
LLGRRLIPPHAPRRPRAQRAALSPAAKWPAAVRQLVPTAPGTYTYSLELHRHRRHRLDIRDASWSTPNLLTALAPTGAITTVGSTVDPVNGDQNPYGLVIAPATSGLITKGDLVVCNFNNAVNNSTNPPSGNVQGDGTTIIGLHPAAGSTPYRIAQSADLQGCNALTMLPDDSISAAAWSTVQNPLGENPLVSAKRCGCHALLQRHFCRPLGRGIRGRDGHPARGDLCVERPGGNINSGGTIDRISLDGDAQTSFTEIVTGICSGGAPGGIFGAAGSPTIRRAIPYMSSPPLPPA